MENKTATSDREGIILMLSELLEKVRHHDDLVKRSNEKKADIERVQKKLDQPRKRFTAAQVIFGIIFAVVGWTILTVTYFVRKSRYTKLQLRLLRKKRRLEGELDAIRCEIYTYDSEILDPHIKTLVPEKFPARYSMNASAIEGMLSLAIDLRGETLKEIINLYEEECHRARVELILGETVKNAHEIGLNTAASA